MATFKNNDPILTQGFSVGNKLVHLLMIVSILTTSCQWKPDSRQAEAEQDHKGTAGVVYTPKNEKIPVFERPEPKLATPSGDYETELDSQEK